MKKMEKRLKVVLVIVLLILAAAFLYFSLAKYISGNVVETPIIKKVNSETSLRSAVKEKIAVTKDNLPDFLEKQAVVSAIPKDGVIILKLYNFNSGKREWEESYKITRGKVELTRSEVSDRPDVVVWIPSKYMSSLGNDFCSTLRTAKNNKDIGIETKLSRVSLLWKYRNVVDYRNCLGV